MIYDTAKGHQGPLGWSLSKMHESQLIIVYHFRFLYIAAHVIKQKNIQFFIQFW